PMVLETPSGWMVPLRGMGLLLQLVILMGCVLVLMNLEKTLRASSGSVRWRVKFMTLGVGSAFAAQLYLTSQTLLFRSVQVNLQTVHAVALLMASALMALAIVRSRGLTVDIYVSQAAIFNSFTVLFAGIYLLSV